MAIKNLVVRLVAEGTEAFKAKMNGAKSSLTSFSNAAKAHAAALKVALLAMIGFTIAYTRSVVSAYLTQQKAEMALESALRRHGDSVKNLSGEYKKFASEIQKVTTYGDEEILGLITQLRNLGVGTDRMKEAVRGTIGLATALGIDLTSAARYSSMAIAGNYTMLSRYIPEVRKAKTDAEKLAAVTKLMTAGFDQQRDAIKTTEGQIQQLKNRYGDLKEDIGRGVVETEAFNQALSSMQNILDGFSASNVQTAISMFGKYLDFSLPALKNIAGTIELISRAFSFLGDKIERVVGLLQRIKNTTVGAGGTFVRAASGNATFMPIKPDEKKRLQMKYMPKDPAGNIFVETIGTTDDGRVSKNLKFDMRNDSVFTRAQGKNKPSSIGGTLLTEMPNLAAAGLFGEDTFGVAAKKFRDAQDQDFAWNKLSTGDLFERAYGQAGKDSKPGTSKQNPIFTFEVNEGATGVGG